MNLEAKSTVAHSGHILNARLVGDDFPDPYERLTLYHGTTEDHVESIIHGIHVGSQLERREGGGQIADGAAFSCFCIHRIYI